MKKTLFAFLFSAFVFSPVVNLQAQFTGGGGAPGTGGSGGGIPTSGGTNAPTVPFDGGLSLILLASGVGYVGNKKKAVL